MEKRMLIKELKHHATKIVKLLTEIEDMNLTTEEKTEIINDYDIMTIHGSISLEQIQD